MWEGARTTHQFQLLTCQGDRAGENKVKLSQRLVKSLTGSSSRCFSSLCLHAELFNHDTASAKGKTSVQGCGALVAGPICHRLREKSYLEVTYS